MLRDYHLGPEVAFFLARPALSWATSSRYEKLRRDSPEGKKMSTSTKQIKYTEAANTAMAPVVSAIMSTLPSKVVIN